MLVEPKFGHAFCKIHCTEAERNNIPSKLREYLILWSIERYIYVTIPLSKLYAPQNRYTTATKCLNILT